MVAGDGRQGQSSPLSAAFAQTLNLHQTANMSPAPTAPETELLLQTRTALATAGHGEKAAVVADACERLGCKPQTLYRKLAALGITTSSRLTRKDKGTSVYGREHLLLIGGMLATSTRNTGKQLQPTGMAVDVAYASGQLPTRLSPNRVKTLLRDHGLHPQQVSRLTPAAHQKSLHPNWCWQIDASVCVLYYLRDGRMKTMPEDEFYKNKPQNLAAVVDKLCVRYACTDHTSGTLFARYYTGGESAANLVEFFLWCVSQREGCPAHGVPWMVMLDPGSANKSRMFVNLLKNLKCTLQINERGNPRAKGQVEQAHNLIERHFEGRLRFMPGMNLETLNAQCEAWQVAFNASRVHTRTGVTRYAKWLEIKANELRIAPSLALMRELVIAQAETRRVSNTMTVSFAVKGYGSADYDVRYVPGASPGQVVKVKVNAYRMPDIEVEFIREETGEVDWMSLAPMQRDKHGFYVDAGVIGLSYSKPPLTAVDHARQEMGMAAYGAANDKDVAKAKRAGKQAYEGVIDAMADVRATPIPTYINKRGTELAAEKRAAADKVLGVAEAAGRAKAALGDDYPASMYAWLKERFAATGVRESELAVLIDNARREAERQAAPTEPVLLRAIAGGRA